MSHFIFSFMLIIRAHCFIICTIINIRVKLYTVLTDTINVKVLLHRRLCANAIILYMMNSIRIAIIYIKEGIYASLTILHISGLIHPYFTYILSKCIYIYIPWFLATGLLVMFIDTFWCDKYTSNNLIYFSLFYDQPYGRSIEMHRSLIKPFRLEIDGRDHLV